MGIIRQAHSYMANSLNRWFSKQAKNGMQVRPAGEVEMLSIKSMGARQIKQLNDVVTYNLSLMENLRSADKEMRKQYVTHLFSRDGADKSQPVIINKMQDAVRIWLQNMATESPRLSIDTNHPDLRAQAWQYEHAVNQHLREIDIGEQFSIAVVDAMFGTGVFKTGLGAGSPQMIHDAGELIDPGRPFTDALSLQHVVLDMAARSWNGQSLIGDRYLRPKGWVKEMLKKSKRGEPFSGVEDLRESPRESEEPITGHDNTNDHRLYDMVYVWDYYLPRERLVVTVPDDCDKPIATWEWDGPEGGPYDGLSYFPACDAPIGPPPGLSLFEMHMFINKTMRKVGRETNNFKNLLLYKLGAEKGAEAIRSASDQAVIGIPGQDLDNIQSVSYGGADPLLSRMLVWTLQLFDQEGGNLQSLGGLGPSAETFRGDKMINENASSLIRFLQLSLLKSARKVLKKHLWWIWTEDIRGYDGEAQLPGIDVSVPWSFTPEEREGDFLDYNFQIEPYSMQGRTPDEKAQIIMQVWGNIVQPSAEMLMQQGQMPNAAGTLQYLCKQYNIPTDVLVQAMDPQMRITLQQQQVASPSRLSQNKHTVNERVSRPGTTPQAQNNEMLRSLDAASKESQMQQAS